MAGTSLLALLDDIATLLDDIALMSKMAAKKTAGVLGDDLALNAEQVSGVKADRELPVVWAVFKGSVLNKLILVPAALLISAIAPWLITPLLMIGGAYLCFEGFEKVLHSIKPDRAAHEQELKAIADPNVDLLAFERTKIKGAIRTDFILSAEIVVIALGTVQSAAFGVQVAVVSTIALLMTVGVYALVAGIVKLDDAGLYLVKNGQSGGRAALGRFLLRLAPYLMKTLSVVGTAAMFLVGGGILLHGIPGSHDWLHHLAESAGNLPAVGVIVHGIVPTLINALAGIIAGALVFTVVEYVIHPLLRRTH
ncbi:hypothetical protein GCM10011352_00970 [Marinobacterium zhoushanense]|uniref:DUF808 domain-containing protein n=1 Tax=Marinobacterium zhoushanense TaxID=1679163 RepID=A0ABQ1JZE6_9GAMM|nr:DUF808 domain-containing protein [Marinobacterium zhoushanense]GGB79134.1 hypothetical protein GCM10011352_00970 [Marinobacterium zhoushanense]